jgi:hypothetical protein
MKLRDLLPSHALLGACVVASGLAAACSPAGNEPTAPASEASSPATPVSTIDLGTTDLSSPEVTTASVAHVDLGVPAPGPLRDVRRMNIDQIDAAIERVTGRRWTDAAGVPQFQVFAANLGKPDFANSVVEDLNASMLFEKFLGDAARAVCADAVFKRDARIFRYARPTDTLATAPDRVAANVQYLVLRFHGRDLALGSTELEPWVWLFDTTATRTGDPARGWRTLCAGLITHPDFVAY